MANDVGQTQLRELRTTDGFLPGQLGNQFSKGGVSEIGSALSTEALSMEEFRQAEKNLGHTPDTLREIEQAGIQATTVVEKAHNQETFQYSLKETGREQSGGHSDANTVTDIGRLKTGIQDPSAHQKKKESKKNERNRAIFAMEQQLSLDRLMSQLSEEIDRLKNKIVELNKDTTTAETLIAEADDLNSANPAVRDAARKKADSYVLKHGGNPDDFKKEDGTYDQGKIEQFYKDQQDKNKVEVDETTTELDEKTQKLDGMHAQTKSERHSEFKYTEEGPGFKPFASDNIDLPNSDSEPLSDSETLLVRDLSGYDLDELDAEEIEIEYYGNEEPYKIFFDEGETVAIEKFTTDTSIGSFSGSGDKTPTNVISGHFAEKSSGTMPNDGIKVIAEVSYEEQEQYTNTNIVGTSFTA